MTDEDGNFEMQVYRPLSDVLGRIGSHFAIMTKAAKETKLPTFKELKVINPEILETEENSVDGLQLQLPNEE